MKITEVIKSGDKEEIQFDGKEEQIAATIKSKCSNALSMY